MDANTLTPADIAAVTRSNENEGLGGGFGAYWIIILFLFVFMGGGFWGNRNQQGDYGQYATAASQQQILFGQQFGQLNDRLTNIGNGICNLGYEMQGNVAALGKEVALGQAGINQQIMGGNYALAQQIADCCCKTQRGLDAVSANIDAKFAALEKSHLKGRIAQLEQANGQLYLAQQMCGVVKYPMSYSYSAGNSPFCGGGCCGNYS
nr:MAG TPA: hypothetical protein [Caudoviricetes sp.]